MENSAKHIYACFEGIIGRAEKERMLKQHARVIWLTGLSGSGKSTIAQLLEKALVGKGFFTQVLDGDNIRSGISNNLGFSDEERMENIRRISEASKLFLNCGIICINSFISPTETIRQKASDIIGAENLILVHVDASLETCEKRDTKGLYEKARKGDIKNFTGIDSVYEKPVNPDITLNTERLSAEDSVEILLQRLLPVITHSEKSNV